MVFFKVAMGAALLSVLSRAPALVAGQAVLVERQVAGTNGTPTFGSLDGTVPSNSDGTLPENESAPVPAYIYGEPTDDLSLQEDCWWTWGTTSDFAQSNLSTTTPDPATTLLLDSDRFVDYIDDIVRYEDAVTVKFRDAAYLQEAKDEWAFVTPCSPRRLIFVANPRSGLSDDRQPYIIGQIGYDDSTNSATLYGPASEWPDALDAFTMDVLVNTAGFGPGQPTKRQTAVTGAQSIDTDLTTNILNQTIDGVTATLDCNPCSISGSIAVNFTATLSSTNGVVTVIEGSSGLQLSNTAFNFAYELQSNGTITAGPNTSPVIVSKKTPITFGVGSLTPGVASALNGDVETAQVTSATVRYSTMGQVVGTPSVVVGINSPATSADKVELTRTRGDPLLEGRPSPPAREGIATAETRPSTAVGVTLVVGQLTASYGYFFETLADGISCVVIGNEGCQLTRLATDGNLPFSGTDVLQNAAGLSSL
ncbi:hypothetical protein F4778DRAFT_777632 [Xylariomycetidae sp. FL2044]|nr:hypothetical protein F4778DRAFT_777632 [Xylariomycetidae sp. FL2044]